MRDRRRITARLAARIANEAAAGATVELLAGRHGLTLFVIEHIVAHRTPGDPPPPRPPRRRYALRAANERTLDPSDLARIHRMADQGGTVEGIVDELGLRPAVVESVVARFRLLGLLAAGVGLKAAARELGIPLPKARALRDAAPYFGSNDHLGDGESYVDAPTRCPTCKAPLVITPCRACRIRETATDGDADESGDGTRLPASVPPGRRTVTRRAV